MPADDTIISCSLYMQPIPLPPVMLRINPFSLRLAPLMPCITLVIILVRLCVCLSVCLFVQTITRAFVRLGASDSTRALLGVVGRSSSLSLAVCGRPAKIRSLPRRHALVWAAILSAHGPRCIATIFTSIYLCAHAPRCNCDDLYPTGHVRRTGSY